MVLSGLKQINNEFFDALRSFPKGDFIGRVLLVLTAIDRRDAPGEKIAFKKRKHLPSIRDVYQFQVFLLGLIQDETLLA
jgi:hypothetical protein